MVMCLNMIYEWMVGHTTKRPWTHIIRDSYRTRPVWWLFGVCLFGTFIGHLFWSGQNEDRLGISKKNGGKDGRE